MWKCHILSFRPSISYIWRFIYVHTLYTLLLPFNDNLVNITFCHHFANKCPNSQSYGFPSSHVRMWKLDHKDGWAPKNWCFQIVVLEKALESPLDCKEIQPVHPQGKSTLNIHGKDWCWNSNTLATWCEELAHWKRSWCWERLRAEGEGGSRR